MTTAPTTSTEIGIIRDELTVLASRMEAVETRLSQNGAAALQPGASAPPPFDLASIMAEVREITQELFPGKCEFTSEFDPEYPEDRYVVVNVEASGSSKEIVDRSGAWHERIRQLWPELWDKLRLFIVPL